LAQEEQEEPVVPAEVIYTPDDARTHGLESLRTVVEKEGVPLPNNLHRYVKDFEAARQLGKALFHEMAIGSDGVQACVTCHFKAGADPRSKNQMSPGLLRVQDNRNGDVEGFWQAEPRPDVNFEIGGPNYQLTRDDFPFVKDIGKGDNLVKEGDTLGPVDGNSNDVASSQGIIFHYFEGVVPGGLVDLGIRIDDDIFNVGGSNTRRVEPRNTPTTINAVFNFTNFWDGRANNKFNGENPFGDQDVGARIYKKKGKGVVANKLNMRNASLASQAVGPPLSHFEMSFGNGINNFRSMPEVGRKVLPRKILAEQTVAGDDSLLEPLLRGGKIHLSYQGLIEKAFSRDYWDSNICIAMPNQKLYPAEGNQFAISNGSVETYKAPCNPGDFNLTEANFAFIYGISVMLYEATLVADYSPFDKWMRGEDYDGEFNDQALKGLNVFVGKGKCVNCHGGPEMTNASVRNAQGGDNMIEPMLMGDKKPAMYDNGFYNIGVTPTVDDLGRGGNDPFGPHPLAFSRQNAFEMLNIQDMPFQTIGSPIPNLDCDPSNIDLDENPSTCDSGILGFHDEDGGGFFPVCEDVDGDGKCGPPSCEPSDDAVESDASCEDGELQNVDILLLKRVAVDGAFKTPGLRNIGETAPYFHNGGSATLLEVVQFYNRGGNFCRSNKHDLDPDIRGLGLSPDDENALVAFMLALTDERVVKRSAPFDGPSYMIPDGHVEDDTYVKDNGMGIAEDQPLLIPAVGRTGGPPLASFLGIVGGEHFVANPVAMDGDHCSPNFNEQ
jgi:cytochrome c peroxidase